MHDASHDCWRTVAPCADSLVLFRSDLVLHRVCALPTMAHRRPSLSSSPALIAMAPSRIGRARMKLALGGPTYEVRGEVRPPAPQRVRRPGPPRAHARGPREHDAPPAPAPWTRGFSGVRYPCISTNMFFIHLRTPETPFRNAGVPRARVPQLRVSGAAQHPTRLESEAWDAWHVGNLTHTTARTTRALYRWSESEAVFPGSCLSAAGTSRQSCRCITSSTSSFLRPNVQTAAESGSHFSPIVTLEILIWHGETLLWHQSTMPRVCVWKFVGPYFPEVV